VLFAKINFTLQLFFAFVTKMLDTVQHYKLNKNDIVIITIKTFIMHK